MKLIRIGALAAASGRSVHAIRWYERVGLLPGVERDTGGRRLYRPDHVAWLGFLDRLQFTGLSIRDLQAYARLTSLGDVSLGERAELLRRHRCEVEARIEELGEALALIDWKIGFYSAWEKAGMRPVAKERPEIRPRNPGARLGRRKPLREPREMPARTALGSRQRTATR